MTLPRRRCRARRAAGHPERGTVTAELALLMPVVVLMLAAVVAAGSAVVAQVRCVDAARAGARLAARSEPGGVVLAAMRRAAPRGAAVALQVGPERVGARVRAAVALPLPGRPALTVQAGSVARREVP